MKYLDFLPHTPYHDLPKEAKAEISAAAYADLQGISSGLADASSGLPIQLQQAYRKRVALYTAPVGTATTFWSWKIAASLGWLAFATLLCYSLISPGLSSKSEPQPPAQPEVIYVHDTTVVTLRDTLERVRKVYIEKVVRDTIYVPKAVEYASTLDRPEEDDSNPSEVLSPSKSVSNSADWSSLTVRGEHWSAELD